MWSVRRRPLSDIRRISLMQNQNRAAVFGFAVRSSEKGPLFVQAQSGSFFRSLFLHLFRSV